MVTVDRLRQVLNYNPETGVFIWKIPTGKRTKVGSVAGSIRKDGYRPIKVDGHRYLAHRLAWLYQTGEWPTDVIDHINGDPSDNRIANLREASRFQNQQNQGVRKNNTSGFKGVSLSRGRWCAEIRVHGKKKSLGSFDTPEEAHAAYCTAAEQFHGKFARVA